MHKTLWVAWREFTTTVWTKGFIIGVLMTPLFILIVIGAMVLVKMQGGPRVAGRVAIIDRSGLVADRIRERFTPEAIEAEQEQNAQRAAKLTGEAMQRTGVGTTNPAGAEMAQSMAAAASAAKPADLTLEVLAPDADVAKEKGEVARAEIKARGEAAIGEKPRLVLAVIPESVVKPDDKGEFTKFDLYVTQRLDFEIKDRIERRIADAIIDARVAADARAAAGGLDAKALRALMRRPGSASVTATAEGDKKSAGEAGFLVPMGFMILLMVSVFTSGQMLLTTTIEEKGSRVMEVLLSAVSPLQLMVGKILGGMGVGLLILMVYSGLGVASLIFFAYQHLLNPVSLIYLVVFFFIAYFLVAAMFAAIGSAVTELREAQTLMTPVMLVLMIPWLLWMPIQRAPNSLFSTILSFVPGTNPFVMVIRLAGSEPVPSWQIPVAIGVGLASAVFAAWAAAKIFRIGVLMYGKPPNLKTLIRWVRLA